jgi:hypothetical protein
MITWCSMNGKEAPQEGETKGFGCNSQGWNPEMSGGDPSGTKSIAHHTHASTGTHVDTRNHDGSRWRYRKVANLRVLHAQAWALWLLCVCTSLDVNMEKHTKSYWHFLARKGVGPASESPGVAKHGRR